MPTLQTVVPDDLAARIAERGNLSNAIRSGMERYFTLLHIGRRELGDMFSQQELAALCDLMNGISLEPFGVGALLAEVADAEPALLGRHGINRSALLEKLRRLTPVQELSLVDAIERFWRAAGTGIPVECGRILEE